MSARQPIEVAWVPPAPWRAPPLDYAGGLYIDWAMDWTLFHELVAGTGPLDKGVLYSAAMRLFAFRPLMCWQGD